jgi:hypothetical protein
MRDAQPQLYLRDEAALAMAEILGTQRSFYPVLVRYVADNDLAVMLGMDEAEAAYEFCNGITKGKKRKNYNTAGYDHVGTFQTTVKEYMENKNGAGFSRWILELKDENCRGGNITRTVLSEAVLDDELCMYDCLRLLIVHWAAQQLRNWTVKIK